MSILYYSLLGFSLLSSGAAAQGPAEVLHSAQTIALGPHATVGGTVVLPNHNTVLFLTNSESRELVAQCLAPDGHTLWQTSLTRFGRAEKGARPLLDNLGLGRKTRTDQQMQQEKAAAELYPLRIFTAGNDVLLAEHISEEAAKQLVKSGVAGPQECQTYVQRLNEQGSLTQHLFGPRPAPTSGKLESLRLSDYADADGYVEVVRETDERAGSVAFWTMHYDLKTNTIRRESLELPATPAHTGNLSQFRHWYQEWAYLGHRPNQTYFCRRTLVSDATQQPGKQPVTYQVYITDDQGKAAPGGFSTTLDLSKGTVPLYSGTIPSYGELTHIPRYYSQQGASSASTYDEWDTSAGGLGSFYLDRSTGDVLIFGEYGTGELPEINYRPMLQGFFERRYAADGRLVAQLQAPYSEAMRAKQKNLSFKGHPDRQLRFHFDPLTGQSRYGFSPKAYSPESFNLVIDRDLKVQRSEYLADKDQNGLTHTSVQFIESFCGYNMDGSTANLRTYGPTAQEELPVYAALANLRQQAGAGSPDHKFYINASSPSAGLVIEQPLGIGGTLKVYTFQTEFLSKN
ncbi:hypothetical protein FNT36_06160 [Hymenobacter setariae]|uniref:Uncharacterized protein n=1 Tax=Hymenobacter setariae TaxID=2594794 RepID=A0A558C4F0_9BACT|nr:hypothetical protein [Hymenobacter setariae]TVT43665.1 hypothetical protein FNT36_06160 [Hymenobacter setariae]